MYIYKDGADFVSTAMDLTFLASADPPPQMCFNVSIIDDDILESAESFTVGLSTVDSAVMLVNDETLVTIVDNNGKVWLLS